MLKLAASKYPHGVIYVMPDKILSIAENGSGSIVHLGAVSHDVRESPDQIAAMPGLADRRWP